MKSLIKSIALANNVFLGRATNVTRFRAFFEAVRPITTNHRLIRIGGEGDGGF